MVSFTAIFATVAATASLAAATPIKRGNSGQATFFYQNGNPGACGNYNDDSTKLVALDSRMYGNGDYCGKMVKITNTDNGKTVVAKVQDECPTCASSGSLDLSTGAFDAIGNQDTGVLPIVWDFIEDSSSKAKRGDYSGQATFFYQNGNPGACGNYNDDSTKLVALDSRMYGNGDYCGKMVEITNTDNGKTVVAKVQDECPTCASSGSLDLSTGAFDAIGNQDTGVLPISWKFVESD